MLQPSADQTEEEERLSKIQDFTDFRQRKGFMDHSGTGNVNLEYLVPASGCVTIPTTIRLGTTYFPKKLPYVFGALVFGYLTHGFYLINKSGEASTPVWYEQSIAAAQKDPRK